MELVNNFRYMLKCKTPKIVLTSFSITIVVFAVLDWMNEYLVELILKYVGVAFRIIVIVVMLMFAIELIMRQICGLDEDDNWKDVYNAELKYVDTITATGVLRDIHNLNPEILNEDRIAIILVSMLDDYDIDSCRIKAGLDNEYRELIEQCIDIFKQKNRIYYMARGTRVL